MDTPLRHGTATPPAIVATWKKYLADKHDIELRDRLVEYYLPWVKSIAMRIAGNLHIEDRENAVGEVLMVFAKRVIPKYNGSGTFLGFAGLCIRRFMSDQIRRKRRPTVSISEPRIIRQHHGRDYVGTLSDVLPAKTETNSDVRFCELTAGLPHRDAIILWIRYYRGLSVSQAAEELEITPRQVKDRTAHALRRLRREIADKTPGE